MTAKPRTSRLMSDAREMEAAGRAEIDPVRAGQYSSLAASLTKLATIERIFDKLDELDEMGREQ